VISYGPGASGRPKSVSGRTATTGATTATITTTTTSTIWEHGSVVIVVVVFVVRIVINIDGLCSAFETVRARRQGKNGPLLGDVHAERISRLTAQTKGACV